MTDAPSFPELLSFVVDRSQALRRAVGLVATLDDRVPSCPAWSVRGLVAHLGEVQRFWAAAVAAGPAERPPAAAAIGDTAPHGDLLAWSAESTNLLVTALRAAGPDRPCWTWWGASDAPSTSGSVARHQVQEATVHAYDAQLAAEAAEPLPASIALDSVDEFVTVSGGSLGAWPHEPARVALHAAEGRRWLVDLSAAGARQVAAGAPAPAAVLDGTASDLLLVLYRRLPLDRLRVDGDQDLAERLIAWQDTA